MPMEFRTRETNLLSQLSCVFKEEVSDVVGGTTPKTLSPQRFAKKKKNAPNHGGIKLHLNNIYQRN